MFIHDNGKVFVASAPRCGHTSMYSYFGIDEYSMSGTDIRQWNLRPSNSKKIIVLRNPVERMSSAYNRMLFTKSENKDNDFENHCRPYLVHISNWLNFYVIDFRNLGFYIPVSSKTIVTESSKAISTGCYINNSKFSKQDLENELEAYNYFITNKPQITPKEWKELTK
jgi:hypothetical protein